MMAPHTGNHQSGRTLLSSSYHTRIGILSSPVRRVQYRSFYTHIHKLRIHHTHNPFYTTSQGWGCTCTYTQTFQNSVCLDSRTVDRHTFLSLSPIRKDVRILLYSGRFCSQSIVLCCTFLCHDRGICMMYRQSTCS